MFGTELTRHLEKLPQMVLWNTEQSRSPATFSTAVRILAL